MLVKVGNPRKPSPTIHTQHTPHTPRTLRPCCCPFVYTLHVLLAVVLINAGAVSTFVMSEQRRGVTLTSSVATAATTTAQAVAGAWAARGWGRGCLTYWLLSQQMTAIRLFPNLIVDAAWEINSNWLKRDERTISLPVERK